MWGSKGSMGGLGLHTQCGDGTPSQLPPHCCSWLQTGSPGSPFSPWKGSKRSCQCPALGIPKPPKPPRQCCASQPGYHLPWSCLVRVPWPMLCPCPCSRTPAHGASAQLTLGPGTPANPRCPVWRESHCKERVCEVTLGCPLPRTHCLGPPTHPVVSWWSWWPHGTRHARGPWLACPARTPWHAWQPIFTLLTLRADGTGW